MKVRVFTDGACSNNGKVTAKAAYACWFPEHKELSKAERVPDDQPQTNNRGELMAIQEAVKIIESKFSYDETEIQIYTDSMYSKQCLTEWIIGWQANNFKNNTILNRDIIEDTVKRLSKFKLHIISHIRAHTGKDDEFSKHNEVVDRMAVAVLNPEVIHAKIVKTNQEKPIEGLPIDMMGPPVSSRILTDWCRKNLNKLDSEEVDLALMTALSKTLKKNGLVLEKQRLHRTSLYRLVAKNLIAEGSKIIKEE